MSFGSKSSNRREFFAQILTGLGITAGVTYATLASADPSKAKAADKKADKKADGPKLVDENDAVAKALKFKHDKNEVDKKLLVTKMGVEGKDQNCGNCIHYKAQEGNVGTCNMLIGKGVVKENGWCNVWTKKA